MGGSELLRDACGGPSIMCERLQRPKGGAGGRRVAALSWLQSLAHKPSCVIIPSDEQCFPTRMR